MKRIELKAQDEYPHVPPVESPFWREGYHFNGYDPLNKVAVSVSIGIRPALGVREEIVVVYLPEPWLFLNRRNLEGGDALGIGSLRMQPLVPLERWSVQMKDSFQKTEHGNATRISKEVNFDLCFESSVPAFGYSTNRGERYEQPGSLKGTLSIGKKAIDFEGRGIRDHSWAMRDTSKWGESYTLFAWFEPAPDLVLACLEYDGEISRDSWQRTDGQHEIREVRVDPVFSGSVLTECRIRGQSPDGELEVNAQLISFIFLPIGGELDAAEALYKVRMGEERGHGFMWYAKQS
jgi:hypothetical protein